MGDLGGRHYREPQFRGYPGAALPLPSVYPEPFWKSRPRGPVATGHGRRRLLGKKKIHLQETEALMRISGGDGRKLLNLFELIVNAQEGETITITNDLVMKNAQQHTALYDKTGEQHYDIVSAFIKSIRGSTPMPPSTGWQGWWKVAKMSNS